MCGIAAILYKESRSAPVGQQLIAMLQSLRHRGFDSTGVTIAGQNISSGNLVITLRLNGQRPILEIRDRIEEMATKLSSEIGEMIEMEQHLRLTLKNSVDVNRLADELKGLGGVEIDSIGTNSQVIKDVGDAVALDMKHKISSLKGIHGIGHVRLATESVVDVTHSHPFWAYPFPDITVVHNGQLTNYRKLKRMYMDKGNHFQTHNDSELIAVYLADKLSQGINLRDALNQSLTELDGSYTYVVSTRDSIGFAKEKWSFKPLVFMERPDVVAVASEEAALGKIFPEEIDRVEPQQKEIMTWQTSA